MKQIRISKTNELQLQEIAKKSGDELLTIPRLANLAMKKGIPEVRKLYVKPPTK